MSNNKHPDLLKILSYTRGMELDVFVSGLPQLLIHYTLITFS